jgi:hypothetical protein
MFEGGRAGPFEYEQASKANGQTWTSSACWHTKSRASLGSGSLASSLEGHGPQFARAGTWPGPELSRLTPQMDSKQLDPFASREIN